METMENVGVPAIAEERHEEIVRIEIEREGSTELISIEIEERDDLLIQVRERVGLGPDIHLFERGGEHPLTRHSQGRRALRLVAHRHHRIEVRVRFEHRTAQANFSPATTVFKVLKWAVGKHGFALDALLAAKANLILPNSEAPLPRDAAIGTFTRHEEHTLVVDLTLKDFTNG